MQRLVWPVLVVVLVVVVVFAIRSPGPQQSGPTPRAQPAASPAPPAPVVVMAVGDIACVPGTRTTAATCRHAEVAAVIKDAAPDFFVALGDLQYDGATKREMHAPGAYDEILGEVKPHTLPVLGNHEYLDPRGPGAGYFDYFGAVGSPNRPPGASSGGFYTTKMGSWQFIALNSECGPDESNAQLAPPGACTKDSVQYEWLADVLQRSKARCTLVAFHRPRWTTGAHPSYVAMAELWDLMAEGGVDVTVSGHNHSNEVFRPIGVSGTGAARVQADGIRSFVAGAGGKDLYPFSDEPSFAAAAAEARDSSTFGPLRLTLRDGSFDWTFVPLPGQSYTNVGTKGAFRGRDQCH